MVDERKRGEIARLLSEGADLKRRRGGHEEAVSRLERAHALATELHLRPWRELAAYRLAHVLIRRAQGPEELHHVDELFAEAAQARSLAPWPQVYRIAVISRLEKSGVDAAVRRAANALAEWSFARSAVDASPSAEPIQRQAFNLLELATYFLGGDYAAIDGCGLASHVGGLDDDSYVVLTGDPLSATVGCTYERAKEELCARAAEMPNALLFELRPDVSRWRLPREVEWSNGHEREIRLLACLAEGIMRSDEELRRHVVGEGRPVRTQNSLFRQVKHRAIEHLGIETPLSEQRGERLRLHPSVLALGIAHRATVHTPPDPPASNARVTRRRSRSSKQRRNQ